MRKLCSTKQHINKTKTIIGIPYNPGIIHRIKLIQPRPR